MKTNKLLLGLLLLFSCELIVPPDLNESKSSADFVDLETKLQSLSFWDKFIRFNVYAANNKANALKDLTGNYSPTEEGSNLIFQIDKGYQGQGVSNPDSYIDTKVIPVDTDLDFDNAMYGVYLLDVPNLSNGDTQQIFGVIDHADYSWYAEINKVMGPTEVRFLICESLTSPFVVSGKPNDGLHVFSQDGDDNQYYDVESGDCDSFINDDPNVTEDIPIYDLWVNVSGLSNGTSYQSYSGFISVSFVSLLLTKSEIDSVNIVIENYLTSIGAI